VAWFVLTDAILLNDLLSLDLSGRHTGWGGWTGGKRAEKTGEYGCYGGQMWNWLSLFLKRETLYSCENERGVLLSCYFVFRRGRWMMWRMMNEGTQELEESMTSRNIYVGSRYYFC
jgi:hypothetical protein